MKKLTELQVIDRERLILNIFSSRGATAESKLQIQLAEIKYQFPRSRETSKTNSGSERPGKGYDKTVVVPLPKLYPCIPNHTRFGGTIITPTVVVIDDGPGRIRTNDPRHVKAVS